MVSDVTEDAPQTRDWPTGIGFVGLGAMGFPMARRLARQGYAVSAFDNAPEVRQRAATEDGITEVATAAEAARGSQVVFTCLPNDRIVREVYLGTGGLVDAVSPEAVTIDCSTVSPGVTRDVHAAFLDRQVHHLDASMLGSVPQAETGEIGFVVGGDPGAVARVGPLLEILGRFSKYAGGPGSANQIKLIHQTLVANNAVAVAEAMALCLKTGTDLDCFYDVVCNGGGFAYSRYFEKRVPRMRDGDFSPLFMLDLMKKDAGLAQQLARNAEVGTPLLDQVIDQLESASLGGAGREDFSAVARIYEKAIGRPFGREDSD